MIPNYRKLEQSLRDVSEITINGCLSRLTGTVIITNGEMLIFSEISRAIRETAQVLDDISVLQAFPGRSFPRYCWTSHGDGDDLSL